MAYKFVFGSQLEKDVAIAQQKELMAGFSDRLLALEIAGVDAKLAEALTLAKATLTTDKDGVVPTNFVLYTVEGDKVLRAGVVVENVKVLENGDVVDSANVVVGKVKVKVA